MKIISTSILVLALSTASFAKKSDSKTKKAEKTATPKTMIDSVSYSIGVNIGKNLKQQNFDTIDYYFLGKAIMDVFNNDSLLIGDAETNRIINTYATAIKEKAYSKIKSESEQFLVENKKRPGVVTLPSGLQYEVLVPGTGAIATRNDKVTVHYTGTLIDGKVFDSSVQRGQPATFGVTQVIKGWTEALQLMPAGSKWKLYIPQDLAYGANPRPGGPIEPYMALIFEVEVLEVVK